MRRDDDSHDSPWAVLGVDEHGTDDAIRKAYLRKTREHPPEREPEAFERIREAYDTLRDPVRRATWRLLALDPEAPLAGLLDEHPPPRRFAGLEAWLAALEGLGGRRAT